MGRLIEFRWFFSSGAYQTGDTEALVALPDAQVKSKSSQIATVLGPVMEPKSTELISSVSALEPGKIAAIKPEKL